MQHLLRSSQHVGRRALLHKAFSTLANRQVHRTSTTTMATKVAFEPASLPSVAASDVPFNGWEGDLLVLGVPEDAFKTEGDVTSVSGASLQQLDGHVSGALAELIAGGGFQGKQGTTSRVTRVAGSAGVKAKHLALVGLGKADKITSAPAWGASCFQALGTGAAVLAKSNRSTSLAIGFLEPPPADAVTLTHVASGVLLGGYETTRFRKKTPTASKLETVHVLLPVADEAAKPALAKAESIARGNLLTRYLVEAPANICTPTHLADAAAHIAAGSSDVMTLQVFDKAQCEAWGMGCYLGVAEASDEPLRFIHLKYSPPDGATHKVAIVGKGLTFDSGGYNIKAGPGSMIELMKFDMGGAAATLGAARIVADLKPAGVEINFIIASCENMIGSRGLRPGDVLTAANGKTVEVNNTDAEGRLTLADALWYAQEKCGATAIVDVATLTGACMIALGTSIAGLFTPKDIAADKLVAASKAAGEKIWRMPMEPSYFEQFKSSIADMKNTGTRMGGAIAAALFLEQYVKEDVEWAHLDIAGPVWDEKAGVPTGYGAALLAEWALAQGGETKA